MKQLYIATLGMMSIPIGLGLICLYKHGNDEGWFSMLPFFMTLGLLGGLIASASSRLFK